MVGSRWSTGAADFFNMENKYQNYLELGPEANKHTEGKERFSEDWSTMGLSDKNTSLDIEWDLNKYPYPLPDDCFEIVFSSHVLEHLDDPLASLQEMYRILKPGGLCRVNVPDARWYVSKYIDQGISLDDMTDTLRSFEPMKHKNPFDCLKVRRLLGEAGFSEGFIQRPYCSVLKLLKGKYFSSRDQKSVFGEGVK